MPISDLRNETWVLVADGEKALFLVNDGDEEYPVLNVRRKEEHENPPTHDQGADRPGRFNDGGVSRGGPSVVAGPNPQRSAVQDTDWHQLEKDRFAEDLAQILYRRAHAGDFGRIVLVAAPHVLGQLRDRLHQEVKDRVVGEVDKTLTNHPVDEIERILKGELSH